MRLDTLCEYPQQPDGWSPYRWCPSPAHYAVLSNRYGDMITYSCREHTLAALQRGGITQIHSEFPPPAEAAR